MDASSVLHHQGIMESESLESVLVCGNQTQKQQEKKPRPAEESLKCPRCESTNTKFCYYNNYSLSQPRYFCKSCKRYWTQGGTLRNVPVGGGCRKNRRTTSSSSSSSSSRRGTSPDPHHQFLHKQVGGSMAGLDVHPENYGNSNISLLGVNPSGNCNSHFALFGNSLSSLNGGLNLNPLCFGLGSGILENVENAGGNGVNYGGGSQEMGMQFDHRTPSSGLPTPTRIIKHEMGENKLLWGLPWQVGGGGGEGNYMNNIGGAGGGDYESDLMMRESWSNGVIGSSWHGLLNSPLI